MKIYKTKKQIVKAIEKINFQYSQKTDDKTKLLYYEGDDSFYILVKWRGGVDDFYSFTMEPMLIFFCQEYGETEGLWICTEHYYFEIKLLTAEVFFGVGRYNLTWREEFEKDLRKLFYNDLKTISK